MFVGGAQRDLHRRRAALIRRGDRQKIAQHLHPRHRRLRRHARRRIIDRDDPVDRLFHRQRLKIFQRPRRQRQLRVRNPQPKLHLELVASTRSASSNESLAALASPAERALEPWSIRLCNIAGWLVGAVVAPRQRHKPIGNKVFNLTCQNIIYPVPGMPCVPKRILLESNWPSYPRLRSPYETNTPAKRFWELDE